MDSTEAEHKEKAGVTFQNGLDKGYVSGDVTPTNPYGYRDFNYPATSGGMRRRSSIHNVKTAKGVPTLTLLNTWGENSSCTGIPSIVRSDNKIRKAFWSILVIVGFVATGYHAYTMIEKFLLYDVSVSIDLSYQHQLSLPSLTICNVNPARQSKIHLAGSAVDNLFPLNGGNSSESNDAFARHGVAEQFYIMFAELPEATKQEMGHQLQDMLLDCFATGVKCDASNFTTFTTTQFGNCYTLDGDLTSSRPGWSYGISLELFVEQAEYIPDLSESAGFVIILHSQDAMPFAEDSGIYLSPGRATNIALRQLEINRLKSPYPHKCWNITDPVEQKQLSLYSDLTDVGYSMEACQKTCYQTQLVNACNCGDYYYPLFGSALSGYNESLAVKVCSTSTQITCETEIKTQYLNGGFTCNCSLPCDEVYYEATVSQAQFPSLQYEAYYSQRLQSMGGSIQTILNDTNNPIREHVLKVRVFYQELNRELIYESAAYGLTSLVADLGGVIGLYVGLSIVAVFEFFELFIDLLIVSCAKRKQRKINGGLPN